MDNGRVIAPAKFAANLGIAARGHYFGEIHCHLARTHNRAGTALGGHFAAVDPVILAHGALNFVNRNAPATRAQNILQLFFGKRFGDRPTGELRISEQFVQPAFKLANIAADRARQKFDHIFADLRIGHIGQTLFKDSAAQL